MLKLVQTASKHLSVQLVRNAVAWEDRARTLTMQQRQGRESLVLSEYNAAALAESHLLMRHQSCPRSRWHEVGHEPRRECRRGRATSRVDDGRCHARPGVPPLQRRRQG